MLEKTLRRRVVEALRPLHAVAVENPVCPGTPDVNLAGGWIELKALDGFVHQSKIVKIPIFTPQQRIWLERRARAGEACYLLLAVGEDCLLLDGAYSARRVGKATAGELVEKCLLRWQGKADDRKLLEFMESRCLKKTC
jgi:hypothetical protein